ncbi:hypothetical protein HK102_007462 [Quaeritorhiza haematococci]|nr:hypothetical protein HK102_007462 [Quaeritorhiza haematococci]
MVYYVQVAEALAVMSLPDSRPFSGFRSSTSTTVSSESAELLDRFNDFTLPEAVLPSLERDPEAFTGDWDFRNSVVVLDPGVLCPDPHSLWNNMTVASSSASVVRDVVDELEDSDGVRATNLMVFRPDFTVGEGDATLDGCDRPMTLFVVPERIRVTVRCVGARFTTLSDACRGPMVIELGTEVYRGLLLLMTPSSPSPMFPSFPESLIDLSPSPPVASGEPLKPPTLPLQLLLKSLSPTLMAVSGLEISTVDVPAIISSSNGKGFSPFNPDARRFLRFFRKQTKKYIPRRRTAPAPRAMEMLMIAIVSIDDEEVTLEEEDSDTETAVTVDLGVGTGIGVDEEKENMDPGVEVVVVVIVGVVVVVDANVMAAGNGLAGDAVGGDLDNLVVVAVITRVVDIFAKAHPLQQASNPKTLLSCAEPKPRMSRMIDGKTLVPSAAAFKYE